MSFSLASYLTTTSCVSSDRPQVSLCGLEKSLSELLLRELGQEKKIRATPVACFIDVVKANHISTDRKSKDQLRLGSR